MRHPNVYSAAELRRWHIEEEYHPDKWRPARARAIKPDRREWWMWLKRRFVLAWRVFVGRCDVVYWGDNSGEWTNHQVKYRDAVDKSFGKLGGTP
jgi:hypothetical protein